MWQFWVLQICPGCTKDPPLYPPTSPRTPPIRCQQERYKHLSHLSCWYLCQYDCCKYHLKVSSASKFLALVSRYLWLGPGMIEIRIRLHLHLMIFVSNSKKSIPEDNENYVTRLKSSSSVTFTLDHLCWIFRSFFKLDGRVLKSSEQ